MSQISPAIIDMEGGAQRPVLRAIELKKEGARSAAKPY